MLLRQIFDPALAQYSYLIGCQRSGEAVIVDPLRDIDRYRALAAQEDLRITAAVETHIHADFVSGVRGFAADPGVRAYVSAEGGADWQSEWAGDMANVVRLRDGDGFRVGRIRFQALHTPGHTPEHMSYLVTDEGGGADEPVALLTGDFLFVGDVGRPDLLEQAAGLTGTQEEGARQLYRSLQKVKALPCHVQVLPAHGAGSACGKALGAVPSSTIGYELKFNTALKLATEGPDQAFVDFILSGQPEPPVYFANMKKVNKIGPPLLRETPAPELLTWPAFAALQQQKARLIVLDTRADSVAFLARHLRGSLFMPSAKFSDFAGSYLSPEAEVVLLLDDPDQADGYVRQLVRMGFDHIAGVLPVAALAGAPAEAFATIPAVPFAGAPEILAAGASPLDVRRATEFAGGHVRGAQNIAHTRLQVRMAELPPALPLLVSCQSGLRAAGAAAFLARAGRQVTCVTDGFENAPPEILSA
jgi:hydroxyacylglutathione hydrolase